MTKQQGAKRSAAPQKKTAAKKSPAYSVPALEKGLTILELLSGEPRGLTQSEMSEHLGRSLNEIFRMVICMRDLGYIAQVADSGRYVLTAKLFQLAHRNPPIRLLVEEALPRMHGLSIAMQQSCHMTIYHSGAQVVATQVDSPGGMGFSVRMGTQLDLLQTASGRILLAFQSKPVQEQMLAEYKGEAAASEITAIHEILRTVREQGYCEMESAQVRGVHGLSYPVCDHRGVAIAALVMPYLPRMDHPEWPGISEALKALGQVSADLSLAIGQDIEMVDGPVSSARLRISGT